MKKRRSQSLFRFSFSFSLSLPSLRRLCHPPVLSFALSSSHSATLLFHCSRRRILSQRAACDSVRAFSLFFFFFSFFFVFFRRCHRCAASQQTTGWRERKRALPLLHC